MGLISTITLIAIVLILYLFLIEIYMALFRITGLTKEKARFQVISMITACGFTTAESEIITSDKKRRNIALTCMISGVIFNVVIIGLLINLIYSLNAEQLEDTSITALIVLGSTLALIIFCKLPFMNHLIQKFIEWVANKLFNFSSNANVLTQLDTYGKDAIYEIKINIIPQALEDKTLQEADIKAKYGFNILMIKRSGRVIELTKDSIVQKKDILVIFGAKNSIHEFFTPSKEELESLKQVTPGDNKITLIDNYGQDAMAEVEVHQIPSILKDKKLSESELRSHYYITILKIKRHYASVPVDKDTMLQPGDNILALGPYKNIKALFDLRGKHTTPHQNKEIANEKNAD